MVGRLDKPVSIDLTSASPRAKVPKTLDRRFGDMSTDWIVIVHLAIAAASSIYYAGFRYGLARARNTKNRR